MIKLIPQIDIDGIDIYCGCGSSECESCNNDNVTWKLGNNKNYQGFKGFKKILQDAIELNADYIFANPGEWGNSFSLKPIIPKAIQPKIVSVIDERVLDMSSYCADLPDYVHYATFDIEKTNNADDLLDDISALTDESELVPFYRISSMKDIYLLSNAKFETEDYDQNYAEGIIRNKNSRLNNIIISLNKKNQADLPYILRTIKNDRLFDGMKLILGNHITTRKELVHADHIGFDYAIMNLNNVLKKGTLKEHWQLVSL